MTARLPSLTARRRSRLTSSGPGSDPFEGIVALEGKPLGTYLGDGVGDADTIVQRLDTAVLPSIPSSDTIDCEVVALSLQSTAPITVTYNGGQDPTWYDVEVTLSAVPAPVGSMTINHSTSEGGTYDAGLLVQPQFTFTKVSNPIETFVLDTGLEGIPAVDMNTSNSPTWEHEPTHDQKVVAGLTGDEFYIFGTVEHDGPHQVRVTTVPPGVPTVSQWGLIALAVVMLTGTAIKFRRRQVA